MDLYLVFKVVHIIGIILWIGPPLGAYWIHLKSFQKDSSHLEEQIELRVRNAFIGVLTIEHIGLLILLVGAFLMLNASGWTLLDIFWIKSKLMIFLFIIIPVEILDIWWGQYAIASALKKVKGDKIDAETRRVFTRYDRLIKASIPVLIVTWFFFFLLAVLKPA
ncbi:MAG: DUF2269 family protein [Spirochaetia bacterium]|nr:DUF2269 family protein [Spirochaetia bacterium]